MSISEAYDLLDKEDKRINLVMKTGGWLDIIYGIDLIIASIFLGLAFTLFGIISLVFGIAIVYRNCHLEEFAWENLDTLIILVVLSFSVTTFVTGILILYVFFLRRKTINLSNQIQDGQFENEDN